MGNKAQRVGSRVLYGAWCPKTECFVTHTALGLGGLCSKIALICYAAISSMKLYHAQVTLVPIMPRIM